MILPHLLRMDWIGKALTPFFWDAGTFVENLVLISIGVAKKINGVIIIINNDNLVIFEFPNFDVDLKNIFLAN